MQPLTDFLHDLLTTGAVTLTHSPAPFAPADLRAASQHLRELHAQDARQLAGAAPPYEEAAATWAAAYLYHAAQLTLVRQLDATAMAGLLADYPGPPTPAAVYAADLTLRHLPDLLALARGLAPADALVTHLQATARRWPLSFAGHPAAPEPDEAAEALVLASPPLRQLYVDRLIEARHLAAAQRPRLRPLVQAALGGHAPQLWPEFARELAVAAAG